MKHMRKIFALALALIMVMGLATTAFATDGEGTDAPNPPAAKTYTITMAPSADGSGVAGHIYEVYQIYTGTMSVINNKETLGEVKYGQDYAGKTAGTEVPKAELDEVAKKSGADAATYFKALIDNSPIATLNDANNHTVENMAAGYYLIVDVSTNLPATETASAFILEVLDDVAINSKHTSSPKTEKKIDDTNNSLEATNEIVWHDSADHDIGDAIPFKLEMTVPSAFEAFKLNNEKEGATRIPYRFVFHDTEEQGLTFNAITKVTVDGVEIESGYELVKPTTDGHTFDVVFADLTAVEGVKVGSKIVVEYTSTLNENAILGKQGNVNTVFGEYRNFNEPETPVYTPEDSVIAFTYKVVINKQDENKQPLAGAEFTLEKFVAGEGTDTYEVSEELTLTGTWVAKTVVKTDAGKVFTFKGLDDGYYRLTETKAPDGYNKIEPIYFTVTADHEINWTMARENVLTSLSGDVVTGEIEFTESEDYSTLSADVENKSGVVLPETGGIGTTIFYIVGGMLAVAAVVLLITKKRMASAE